MIVGLSDKGKEFVKTLIPILPYKIRKYIKMSTKLFKTLDVNELNINTIMKSIRK